ncbi:hypothetical protein CFIMG_008060RA00001 [Ceratocystis fimbriata CBS 114723]|uniref:Karyogamy protein n=1 Tax=Ceratocystis fimbriata CBS 114723 TaxID=1035309 RepID=A0A2C5X6Y5_9PEZI|nr:hypothetical protein CFIMG_008060RA00001 [Ceratocystis fimbriata CBS 114723]
MAAQSDATSTVAGAGSHERPCNYSVCYSDGPACTNGDKTLTPTAHNITNAITTPTATVCSHENHHAYTYCSALANSSTSSLDSTIGISSASASFASAAESDREPLDAVSFGYLSLPVARDFASTAASVSVSSSPSATVTPLSPGSTASSKPLPEITVHPDANKANNHFDFDIDFSTLTSHGVVHLPLLDHPDSHNLDFVSSSEPYSSAQPQSQSQSQSPPAVSLAHTLSEPQFQPQCQPHVQSLQPSQDLSSPLSSPHHPPPKPSLASRVFRSRSPSAAKAKQTPRPQSLAHSTSSPSLAQPATVQSTRKPSPGLAARLKALGFASATSKASPPATTTSVILDRAGGLVQHQARQLDENHQASSSATGPAPTIARRARPWKGTVRDISAAIANTISRSASFESLRSPRSVSDNSSALLSSPTNDDFNIGLSSPSSVSSNFLVPPQSPSAFAVFSTSLQDLRSASSPNLPALSDTASITTSPSTSVCLPEIQTLLPLNSACLPEIHTTPPLSSTTLLKAHTPPVLNMDASNQIPSDDVYGNDAKDHTGTLQERADERVPASSPHSLTLDTQDSTEIPPPPPPKDTPPPTVLAVDSSVGLGSEYFVPRHGRAGSIYTLSRASFANQLAQLTSLQLPDADSLSNKVAAIPTAHAANNALINAAEQIRGWIAKASDVIDGLDSDDDVEWAAAGGREGLDEVEKAIVRFEDLINIYVSAIEDLQKRSDIGDVSTNDLNKAVVQMEHILEEWMKIRKSLNTAKEQVEIAMEWEELWNNVLGDIQGEMDELSRLVFEMEERRHKSMVSANENVDIGDLETIVEEVPANSRTQPLSSDSTSPESPGASFVLDDSSLLALFARMQPLRASLDFLPMRLSVFENRAKKSFPTACDELEMRRTALDGGYKKLEKDAECLRKELGEDRWVSVFRNAGRQAEKMYESVHRSVDKLQEAIDTGCHLTNPPLMTKKIESYEAKKMHYGPAIERVLSIIDKGVKDRLTVNGEILCLHSETQTKWASLKRTMAEMDLQLEEVQSDSKGQQLRDSISSLLSSDYTSTGGSRHETPSSSPPSSVFISSLGFRPRTPGSNGKRTRGGTTGQQSHRNSLLPSPSSQLSAGRKAAQDRLYAPVTPNTNPTTKPSISRLSRAPSKSDLRPKWNASTNTNNIDTGHNFVPLTLTTPSPYAKRPMSVTPGANRPVSTLTPGSGSASRLPKMRSFSMSPRSTAASPAPGDTPTRNSQSRLSFRDRINNAVPGPYIQQAVLPKTRAPSRTGTLASQSTATTASTTNGGREMRRASYQPRTGGNSVRDTSSPPTRPASSLAFNSRRSSVLPVPTSQLRSRAGSADGRNTPSMFSASRTATSAGARKVEQKDTKPRWRF